MNTRGCKESLFHILLLIALLVLITSCSPDAAFGDQVRVHKSFKFYIASGYGRYAEVPEQAYQLILADPAWSGSEGLTVEEAELDIAPTDVSWTAGDTRYTAKGLKLTVDVCVQVAEDTNAGTKAVTVELPGLSLVASALGGDPKFPDNAKSFTSPNRVEVTEITVHGSAFGKYFAITGKVISRGHHCSHCLGSDRFAGLKCGRSGIRIVLSDETYG